MRVLGLTGGMGMGKTTVAAFLSRAGFPVFDADATVRALQADHGKALPFIAQLVPESVRDGHLDRGALRRAVVQQPALLRQLEKIIHPMVWAERTQFLRRHRQQGARWVVLDIPLLFEAGAWRLCDYIVVVSAPARIQAGRVALRRSITKAEARRLIARQMPDRQKRRRADCVIRTGGAVRQTIQQVQSLIRMMKQ